MSNDTKELELMTYIIGGKAMTLEQLKAHQAAESKAYEVMAESIREENELRQKIYDARNAGDK